MKIIFVFLVFFVSLFTNNVFAEQLMQFEHKVRNTEYKKSLESVSQYTLAIARVNDLKSPDASTFDDKGKEIISISGLADEKITVYSSKKIAAGFRHKTREILNYYLSKQANIQLIERENINSLLREWEFSESKYVKKSEQLPAGIEIPDLIATGFLSHYPLCDKNDDLEEAWGLGDDEEDDNDVFFNGRSNEDEAERRRAMNAKAMPFSSKYAKKKDKSNFYFLLRVYETRSSRVKYIACGDGKTVKSAIKRATNDFSRNI